MPIEVRVVPPDARSAALELVFQDLAPEIREQEIHQALQAAAAEPRLMEGLFHAEQDGHLAGAVWIQEQTGHTANLWPPRTTTTRTGSCVVPLLAEVIDFATRRRLTMIQSLLAADATADAANLADARFEHVADVHFMASLAGSFPASLPKTELEFESHTPRNEARLARMVEATYRETLDCPWLNGVRDTSDVLSGYRETGVFDPSRWLLLRHAGRDVGALLLADHPATDQWEIVYMGLVPEARGHGWGLELVRYAQWLVREAGRSRLVLAVDAENRPAIDAYQAAGFVQWDTRQVHIRMMSRSARGKLAP